MSVARAAYPTYSAAGGAAAQQLSVTQGAVYGNQTAYQPSVVQAPAAQYAAAGCYGGGAPWDQSAMAAVGSYGGYDAMTNTQSAPVQPPPPQPPRRLTEGLPTPQSVDQQKQNYAKALEAQLESGKRTIQEQTIQAKSILQQQAEEKKMTYAIQIEEQLMQQEMSLDQQTHEKVMQLHQAAFTQKAQLEQQASNLTLEFRQKQMMEQLEHKRYEMQMRQCDMRERMQQAYKGKADGAGAGQQPMDAPYPSQHMPAPTMPAVPQHMSVSSPQGAQLPTSYEAGSGMYTSGLQYGSIGSHQPQYQSYTVTQQEAGSPYGVPPTQYAQPQTTMVPPPTSMGGH